MNAITNKNMSEIISVINQVKLEVEIQKEALESKLDSFKFAQIQQGETNILKLAQQVEPMLQDIQMLKQKT